MKPAGDYTLRIRWVNGKDLPVDLREIVHRLKGLRALRDPSVFARATVGEERLKRGMAWGNRYRCRAVTGARA